MISSLYLLPLCLVICVYANDNGRAITPSTGWRSWNQFQGAISQNIMQNAMTALAAKTRTVDGVPTSFADLGYNDAGIDDMGRDDECID